MNELKPIAIALMIAGIGASSSTYAASASDMSALSARVDALEAGHDASSWSESVQFGGVIEVESYSADNASDISTATVEIDLSAELNDYTTAEIILLDEDIDTEDHAGLGVDTATITINMGSGYITAGQMWLPFGRFDTYQLSDPLTLEIGETYNSALMLGFDTGVVYGSLYTFNGVSQKVNDDDKIAHFGGNLGLLLERNSLSLDIGVSYISSIAESGLISWTIEDNNANAVPPGPAINGLNDLVTGTGFHLVADMGPFSVMYEQVKANDDVVGADTQVSANNAEIALHLEIGGKDSTIGFSSQGTADAAWLGLPEKATLASFSMDLFESTSLGFEFSSTEDYAGNKSDVSGVRLAVEF